jgi:hypothetical protein
MVEALPLVVLVFLVVLSSIHVLKAGSGQQRRSGA